MPQAHFHRFHLADAGSRRHVTQEDLNHHPAAAARAASRVGQYESEYIASITPLMATARLAGGRPLMLVPGLHRFSSALQMQPLRFHRYGTCMRHHCCTLQERREEASNPQVVAMTTRGCRRSDQLPVKHRRSNSVGEQRRPVAPSSLP